MIGLRPEKIDEYVRLHAAVWPDVLEMIRDCNIRNYSIYLAGCPRAGITCSATSSTWATIFGRHGPMAADPVTQQWWDVCKPCQDPLADRAPASGGRPWTRCFTRIEEFQPRRTERPQILRCVKGCESL